MMEVSLNVPLGEQPHLKEMFAIYRTTFFLSARS